MLWHNGFAMPKSAQLTVTVPPELEAFVRDRVASGRFDTASDVVREGLTLLKGREHEREAAIAEIRAEIAVGLDQARAGQLRDGETFFGELARKRPS
jgi:antitoxin ParD1/3/4